MQMQALIVQRRRVRFQRAASPAAGFRLGQADASIHTRRLDDAVTGGRKTQKSPGPGAAKLQASQIKAHRPLPAFTYAHRERFGDHPRGRVQGRRQKRAHLGLIPAVILGVAFLPAKSHAIFAPMPAHFLRFGRLGQARTNGQHRPRSVRKSKHQGAHKNESHESAGVGYGALHCWTASQARRQAAPGKWVQKAKLTSRTRCVHASRSGLRPQLSGLSSRTH